MKVTWKPPIQQSIHSLLCNLSKQDILPTFKKQYLRSMTESDVWKGYDKQTKMFYSKQLKKPFNYFQEQQYKKQKEVAKLASKLKNREECVDYFSWEGTKLFFKNKEMDPNSEENYEQNPFYMFSKFDRKAFISGAYDNLLSSYAEMSIDNVKLLRPRYSVNEDRSRTEESSKLSKSLKRKPQSFKITVTKQQKLSPLHRKNTINYLRSPTLKKRGSNRNTIINSKGFEMQKSWRINQIERSKLEVDEAKLIQRMKVISQNPAASKSSVRVYKQQLKTVITDRYGQDNFTSFFSIDYILGYLEMEQLTKKILEMDQQVILYMCFNILDSDHDGELSSTDLFSLLQHSKDNQLLEMDYLRIAHYYLQNSSSQMSKSPGNDLLTNQFPTYLSFMNKKRSSNIQQQISIQKLPKFFSLLEQNKSSGRFKKKLSKRSQRSTSSSKSPSLHYEVYKSIFKNHLPMLYYDVLFVVSGIKNSKLKYLSLKQPNTTLLKTQVNNTSDYSIKRSKYYRLRSSMRDAASVLPRVQP